MVKKCTRKISLYKQYFIDCWMNNIPIYFTLLTNTLIDGITFKVKIPTSTGTCIGPSEVNTLAIFWTGFLCTFVDDINCWCVHVCVCG